MGRKPTISRSRILDLAEEIVRTDGAKALTIDALARAAGISKGGVQYSFASKDDLVRALVERWTGQFDAMIEQQDGVAPATLIRSYIRSVRDSQPAMNAKMAGLMAAYLQDAANLSDTRTGIAASSSGWPAAAWRRRRPASPFWPSKASSCCRSSASTRTATGPASWTMSRRCWTGCCADTQTTKSAPWVGHGAQRNGTGGWRPCPSDRNQGFGMTVASLRKGERISSRLGTPLAMETMVPGPIFTGVSSACE